MRQFVQISLFLTVAVSLLIVSCQTDGHSDEEVADPEAEYFDDYESTPNKWGFLNANGEVVIEPTYDQVSGFNEGLAPVNHKGKWGYIDQHNRTIIPFTFRGAWQFHNGIARTMDFDGTPCFILRDGTKKCRPDITELYDFSEGLAPFQLGLAMGYMDTSGAVTIEATFDQAWSFENGIARVIYQGKQGLINKSGEYIIKPDFDKVSAPSSDRILVRQGIQYYFINLQGKRASENYSNATSYINGIAAVADQNGWRLMDLDEKPLTESRYASLRPAGENRWIAKQVELLAVLDESGNPLTPFQYTQINNYSEGFAAYSRDELWGFLDISGKEMTPPQFGLVWDFKGGFARAAFADGIAFIDTSGQVPFSPEYFEMRDFSEGLVPFQEQ